MLEWSIMVEVVIQCLAESGKSGSRQRSLMLKFSPCVVLCGLYDQCVLLCNNFSFF